MPPQLLFLSKVDRHDLSEATGLSHTTMDRLLDQQAANEAARLEATRMTERVLQHPAANTERISGQTRSPGLWGLLGL